MRCRGGCLGRGGDAKGNVRVGREAYAPGGQARKTRVVGGWGDGVKIFNDPLCFTTPCKYICSSIRSVSSSVVYLCKY